MKCYLVGGAVRDKLLGLPHTEKDWVVLGSTPDEMIQLGYRPVGKDFPVFLHPQTHEEYALARTERKTGKGYTQFVFHASPDVTLEEDLKRRDLTMNAIAMDNSGKIIDPYHGQDDIKKKLLKHVSDAFLEDPVRILRVGRLLARFAHLGFRVAPATQKLMRQMVEAGEVDALVPDRVWQEMDRALGEKNPEKFFEVLKKVGALSILFPGLRPPKNFAVQKNPLRFAALFLKSSIEVLEYVGKKYPVPVYYRELALLAHHTQKLFQRKLKPKEMIDLLERTDAYRRPERFEDVLQLFEKSKYIAVFKQAFELTRNINVAQFQKQGLEGKALGQAIHHARIEKIQKGVV